MLVLMLSRPSVLLMELLPRRWLLGFFFLLVLVLLIVLDQT